MQRKILLVDDSAATIKSLGAKLQKMKFKVAAARDSVEARRLITKYVFDLVIVGMNIEGMDGIEFAKRTKQSERYHAVPFVMLTAEGEQAKVAKAKKAGLGLFLPRPVEIDRLKRLLVMAFGGNKARFSQVGGQEIFEINCATDSSADIQALIVETAKRIRNRPPKSVLTLTTLVHGVYSNELVAKLSELAKGNEPYVKKAAIVGVTGIYQTGLTAVSIFSRRNFKVCTTKEEAIAYLTAG